MRDEGDGALASVREVLRVAREAKVPAQLSHVKLASRAVWGKAEEVLALVDEANRQGQDITLDVYPYLFWQSTITAMTTSRDFENLAVWEKALADVGGSERVRLTYYAPNPAWAGKTLAALEKETGRPAAELVREIVRATRGTSRGEAVVVTAMEERDLRAFLRHPKTMFCSDAGLAGTHPRTAGAFPRVLGRYVREERVLKLEEAVRKMTSLPAHRFGFRDRGEVRPGKKADLVLFDARKVADRATVQDPLAAPVGIPYVMVNGRWVLEAGKITGQHPGQALRRQ
jgi:N-acyl-D-amino-acid deacylase